MLQKSASDLSACKLDFQRRGRLRNIPTEGEVNARLKTTSVLVTEIPSRSASHVLRAIDSVTRGSGANTLKHLRRCVTTQNLSIQLQKTRAECINTTNLAITAPAAPSTSTANHASLVSVDGQDIASGEVTKSPQSSEPRLHILACTASAISIHSLQTILSSVYSALGLLSEIQIRILRVPANPPISKEQARQWSQDYWPTQYTGGNTCGPHPPTLARAASELQNKAGSFLGLAMQVGSAALVQGIGEPFGAIVVDRSGSSEPIVVVAAGDARWVNMQDKAHQGSGNALAHAVMRVINLLALKRRTVLTDQHAKEQNPDTPPWCTEQPLTDLERDIYSQSKLASGGYLALGLELYVTHEPCVMCCMSILHSRFGRVVFGSPMPRTGGFLVAADRDQSTDYGLWWRSDLNWRLLAWQWVDDDTWPAEMSTPNIHA